MADEDEMQIVQGSGNIFRDLGMPDSEVLQAKALLAVEIAKPLDGQKLTVRGVHEIARVPAADFFRIRKARLERFTVDRLMRILTCINRDVVSSVSINSREARNALAKIRGIEAVVV